MANLSAGYTFGSTETVTNTKLATLVNSGSISNIENADIAASAAIAYSKLNLTGNVSDSDISSIAAIEASKLNLTSPGPIGSTSANTGAFSTLNVGTENQGDVLYDNGTSFVRLVAGTAGQVLNTGGSSANPSWANALSSVLDYTTNTGTSSAKQGTALKIAFGTTGSLAHGGTFTITNLPFTSSTSYYVFTSPVTNTTVQSAYATNSSASQCVITSMPVSAGTNVNCAYNWIAIGT